MLLKVVTNKQTNKTNTTMNNRIREALRELIALCADLRAQWVTTNSFTIYVPSVRKDGNPIENRTEWLNGIVKEVCQLTGGCTATEGKGSYVMKNGDLVTENVTLLNSFGVIKRGQVEKIAENIKNGGFQESVLFVFNNKPYFI